MQLQNKRKAFSIKGIMGHGGLPKNIMGLIAKKAICLL
jgi:hypothetical protein